jgi:hypothetical protein
MANVLPTEEGMFIRYNWPSFQRESEEIACIAEVKLSN